MRTATTEAVVLRARDLGEADRIVTLFTTQRGKVDAVAKGARRPKSTLGGHLSFLAEVRVTLHRGRSLDVITQVQTVRAHWSELVAPAAFGAASLVAELVDAFCEPDLAQPEIDVLLRSAIAAFAATETPAALVPRFQLRLLHALGLAPADDACIRCGGGLAEAWVDLGAGGLGCERCYGGRGDGLALDPADVANFRALAAPRGAGAAGTARPRVARAVDDFVAYQLGKRPRSRAFLDTLGA